METYSRDVQGCITVCTEPQFFCKNEHYASLLQLKGSQALPTKVEITEALLPLVKLIVLHAIYW